MNKQSKHEQTNNKQNITHETQMKLTKHTNKQTNTNNTQTNTYKNNNNNNNNNQHK